jgi:hypothetical protein
MRCRCWRWSTRLGLVIRVDGIGGAEIHHGTGLVGGADRVESIFLLAGMAAENRSGILSEWRRGA